LGEKPLAISKSVFNYDDLMKSSSPQIEHLKLMLSLEEKRAALHGELGALDARLSDLKRRLVGGSPVASVSASASAPKVTASKSRRRSKRSGRGELKSQIFGALERAGAGGVRVVELAKSLGTKPANIYAWFHAALKRYPSIKKTGGGSYRLAGKAPATSSPAKAPAKATAKAPKAKGTRGGKRSPRGQVSSKILGALQAAGASGVTIKTLSSKLSMPYRNLQVWFATTGKKNKGIKKIAPATYQLKK
jgi:hypothetical protein